MKIDPNKTINELLVALSYAIDIENNKKIFHAWKVAILSAKIAENAAGPQKLKDIFYGGLLHDVGGVEFSHHIIHYLKRQDKASRNLLLSHPIVGAQLVSNLPQMTNAAKLILDHHEWINGSGYPRSKTQKFIPFGSQVIRMADAIDILLQKWRSINFSELKKRLSLNTNKEHTKILFRRALDILKRSSFLKKISDHALLPGLFEEVRNGIGPLKVPAKIDAIGSTLEIISQIIDMKHPYTSGHSLRVSRYAIACALAMNLGHDEITEIKWAGLIHDIGKLSVSRRILDKPTPLTHKEFEIIKQHPYLTRKIMDMTPSLQDITSVAANHHEFYDGTGYPLGLKGNEIPRGARILSICDAFDAMTSNRPYRNPLTPQQACREIEKHAGTQFDAEIVKQTLPLFRNLAL
ncbi:MAG: HD domain-containing phosphohydrolase [Candidatus Omnitrophota bacterium]